MTTSILDDTEMDRIYHELGGHNTDTQKLTKQEKELLRTLDNNLRKKDKNERT